MRAGDRVDPSRRRSEAPLDWFGAPFVFSRPTDSIVARHVDATFDSGEAAVEALRSGAVGAVVGALPFRPGDATALLAPTHLERRAGPLPVTRTAAARSAAPGTTVPGTIAPAETTIEEIPPRADHGARISRALDALRAPTPSVEKVVLARALRIVAAEPIDPYRLLERLIAGDSAGNGFAVDLSVADGLAPSTGPILVGSSPEVLIRRRGRRIAAHPLAGTVPRGDTPDDDRRNAELLAASDKNRAEHAYLVEHLRTILTPLCSQLEIPTRPEVTSTPQVWHLGTPIVGTLADPAPSALEVALALHPTPAVCGTPTDAALEMIAALEGDRGFYAGAVGWVDAAGDGEWLVAIRCATVSADRREVLARAGGGIVAESTVDDEIAETSAKFRTILAALDPTG